MRVYVTVILLNALSIILYTAVTEYDGLALLGVLYGLTYGASVTMMPIMVLHLVDIKDFTRAYGLVSTAQAPLFMVGNAIIRSLAKASPDPYPPIFSVAAVIMVLSVPILAWSFKLTKTPNPLGAREYEAIEMAHLRDPSAASGKGERAVGTPLGSDDDVRMLSMSDPSSPDITDLDNLNVEDYEEQGLLNNKTISHRVSVSVMARAAAPQETTPLTRTFKRMSTIETSEPSMQQQESKSHRRGGSTASQRSVDREDPLQQKLIPSPLRSAALALTPPSTRRAIPHPHLTVQMSVEGDPLHLIYVSDLFLFFFASSCWLSSETPLSCRGPSSKDLRECRQPPRQSSLVAVIPLAVRASNRRRPPSCRQPNLR
eukprot:m.445343 g.445343  ORF g.445343 m.445343 type:complete len:372 (-) comp56850_c0_seq1:571-1686(-)